MTKAPEDAVERALHAAALITLRRTGVPTDVQELLVHGSPGHVPPGILKQVLKDALDALQPGDLLPNDLILRSPQDEEEMADYLYRQAAEATREACAELAWREGYKALPDKIRALDITEIPEDKK